jgi:3'-phosphoadenosine 5'-phosphosulfate sulfotransferase (PAPS reductase)/FAD synthetase
MTDTTRLNYLQAAAQATLADVFALHERVFLSFSGGKDSLALLSLCEPWRDRVTLLWSNTGFMAAHMAAFVRGHADQYDFVEVSPERDMLADWDEHGTPADVVAIEHLEGLDWRTPRVRPWPLCCATNRTGPLATYLARFGEPCAFLNGQRQSDRGTTLERMASIMPPNVTTVMPLWTWSEADVLAYIEAQGIRLPPHHDVFQSSFECAICPADIKPGRLRILDQLDPHAAAFVRATARISLGLAATKAREIETVLNETASQEIR